MSHLSLEVGGRIAIAYAFAMFVCIVVKHQLTKLNLAESALLDEVAVCIGQALEEGHDQLKGS